MEYLLVKRKSKKDNKDTKIKKMKRTLKWGFFRKAAEVLMSSRFFLCPYVCYLRLRGCFHSP